MKIRLFILGLIILGISGVALAGNEIRLEHDNGETATLILVNDNGTECTTKFIVNVFDSDWIGSEKWLTAWDASAQGLTLRPGDSYMRDFSVYGATDWKLRILNNRCKN